MYLLFCWKMAQDCINLFDYFHLSHRVSLSFHSVGGLLIDSYPLCYQAVPRCAAITVATAFRLPSGAAALARPINQRGENSMLVLLGYFLIAAGAGVAASGIIGYILASMVIRRFGKADSSTKISSTSATIIQPISYPPTPSPAPTHVPRLPSSS